MSTFEFNVIESYFGLLKNLTPDRKQELIARLSKSIKTSQKNHKESLKSLFGAFLSDKSADELIEEIKSARNFNRKTAHL